MSKQIFELFFSLGIQNLFAFHMIYEKMLELIIACIFILRTTEDLYLKLLHIGVLMENESKESHSWSLDIIFTKSIKMRNHANVFTHDSHWSYLNVSFRSLNQYHTLYPQNKVQTFWDKDMAKYNCMIVGNQKIG